MKELSPIVLSNENHVFINVMQALAGALPGFLSEDFDEYEYLENIKIYASRMRNDRHFSGPEFLAPYFVLHAYSHWVRAFRDIQNQPVDIVDSVFPYGYSFRDYLGAWLWSVGKPQLKMTGDEVSAVAKMTGAVPTETALLPTGHSLYVFS